MIQHPQFGMSFFEIIESEDMSMLALHDRCSSQIQKSFPKNYKLAGYPKQTIQPIVYCVLHDRDRPLMYFLNSCAHYPCLSSSSDINLKYTPDGHNILHLAVISNSVKCVRSISKFVYPSDYINTPLIKNKNTSLHLAINQGNLEIIESLLKYGANPLLKNINGDSAFHLALNSNLEIAKIIGKYIIDQDPSLMVSFLNDKYCKNKTALKIFTLLKKNDVVALLTQFQDSVKDYQPQVKTKSCSISSCNNCSKIQRCHICLQYFCPKHVDMHFHDESGAFTTEYTNE